MSEPDMVYDPELDMLTITLDTDEQVDTLNAVLDELIAEERRAGRLPSEEAVRTYCTNPCHNRGDHDSTCVPPAEPDNPELRLLRAIYGLCPLCDRTDEHEHPDEEIIVHGMVPYMEEE